MKRINTPLLLIGIGLAVVAVVAIFLIGTLINPAPIQVPVAVSNLPAGTVMEPAQFRLEAWQGVRPETLAALYTAQTFPVGAQTLVDVPAGSPLYRAHVAAPENADYAVRLSEYVSGTHKVIVTLPVKPHLGGNVIVNGDQVDLIFSLGTVQARQLESTPEPTPALAPFGQPAPRATPPVEELTQTLDLPVSVFVLQNIPVLRVEREQIVTSGGGLPGQDVQPTVIEGDALRLYLVVTRPQAEALAFLQAHGEVLLGLHPADGRPETYPGGLTWTDFEEWFFERRPTPPRP